MIQSGQASAQSDIFSLGCVLYYLLNIDQGEKAFILNISDIFNTSEHSVACGNLKRDIESKFAGLPYALKHLLTSSLDPDPANRGTVNTLVENQFFQDPLIKTIKYLENIETKEHHNVVQFLTGLTRILDKFDKRTCIRKIIPLMLECVHKEDLSILILPAFIKMLKKEDFMTKDQFYESSWSQIARLCQAGELQAQALYMLVDNIELFFEYVNAKDFQDVIFPLLLKSLECGVHKLQGLGVQKIAFMSKKIEYMTFKSQLMPRFLMILTNKDIPLNLKEQGCEVLIQILSVLDRNFLRDNILKTLQALRDSINEPKI